MSAGGASGSSTQALRMAMAHSVKPITARRVVRPGNAGLRLALPPSAMKRRASLIAIPASAVVIGFGLAVGPISAWDAIRDPERHEWDSPQRESARIGLVYGIWVATIGAGVAVARRSAQPSQ